MVVARVQHLADISSRSVGRWPKPSWPVIRSRLRSFYTISSRGRDRPSLSATLALASILHALVHRLAGLLHALLRHRVARFGLGRHLSVFPHVLNVAPVVPPLLVAAAEVHERAWRILAGQEHVVIREHQQGWTEARRGHVGESWFKEDWARRRRWWDALLLRLPLFIMKL